MNEILINKSTAQLQFEPAITASTFGTFVVAWTDTGTSTVKYRRFDSDGTGFEERDVVAPTPGGNVERHRPAIASIGFGTTVLAWVENAFNPPGLAAQVVFRRVVDDTVQGEPVRVNTSEVDPSWAPSIAMLIDGGFVIAWAGADPDQRIKARRFRSDGSPNGAEITVATEPGFHEAPLVRTLEDGQFVIVWRRDPSGIGGGVLQLQVFGFEGDARTEVRTPDISGFTGGKALTLLAGGGFVVAHVRQFGVSDIGVTKSTVEANIFDANGVETGFGVVATGAADGEVNCSSPALAQLPGRFVLAWCQRRADTFDTHPVVRAKVVSLQSGSLEPTVDCSTSVAEVRSGVRAATVFAGEPETAFVVWSDNGTSGGDTSAFGVRGRALPLSAGGGFQ